jgi:hypothetical protein
MVRGSRVTQDQQSDVLQFKSNRPKDDNVAAAGHCHLKRLENFVSVPARRGEWQAAAHVRRFWIRLAHPAASLR